MINVIMLVKLIIVITLLLTTINTHATDKLTTIVVNNVIDRTGTPHFNQDFDSNGNQHFNPLFDLGSWHGFLLPDQQNSYGAFTGPLLIMEEYSIYLAEKLEQLSITNIDSGQLLALNKAKITLQSSPGKLQQIYQLKNITIKLSLAFINSRSALITTEIINNTSTAVNLQLTWQGELLTQFNKKQTIYNALPTWQTHLMSTNNSINIAFNKVRSPWLLLTSGEASYTIQRSIITNNSIKNQHYSSIATIHLAAKKHHKIYTTQSYYLTTKEQQQGHNALIQLFQHPEHYLQKTARRWQQYLATILPTTTLQQNNNNHIKQGVSAALKIKALSTLISNWRSPAGALKHDIVTPSVTARWFNGAWAWDSYKHAYALASIAPELAKNSLRAMFDYQITAQDLVRPQDKGMIIDAIFYNQDSDRGGDGGNWNERNSKPPLASWAVWQIYQKSGDINFIKEMFPKLKAYHQWWYKNRDHNHNGLVEYGATKHRFHNDKHENLTFTVEFTQPPKKIDLSQCKISKVHVYRCAGINLYQQVLSTNQYQRLDIGAQHASAWESGMDNAARFSFITDLQLQNYANQHYRGNLERAKKDWQVRFFENRDNQGKLLGFSLNQESVELNSYLAQEKILLAKMAKLLHKNKIAKQYRLQAKILRNTINQCFFDDKTGFYYDRQFSDKPLAGNQECTGKLLVMRGKGAEGWSPLAVNIADNDNAKKVIAHMLNSAEFNGHIPLPTAAYSNPAYGAKIYWRGRVWIDQFYFGIKALKNYGYPKEANKLITKLLNNAQGLNGNQSIHENYDPQTGKALGATNFSWSAAHLLMLANEVN